MDESLSSRTGYLQSLKASLHKLLTNYRRDNDIFTGEKPGRHHLNHVTKVKLTEDETDTMCLLRGYTEEHPFPDIPVNNARPESNHEGTSHKSKLRTGYETPYAVQRWECCGAQKDGLKNCSR